MKASLINYQQAPRKVRVVTNLIKGKTVPQALDILAVTTKRASSPLSSLLNSAVANAKSMGVDVSNLIVKECTVNSGMTLKRHMPGARGSAFPIKKHASHVHLVLGTKEIKAPRGKKVEAKTPVKAEVKAEAKTEKKAVKAKVSKAKK